MAIKYKGKRFKIHPAKGFRLGIGYIPHYLSNQDTDRPREIMLWLGPYILGWTIQKKGRVPRKWYALSRMRELEQTGSDFLDEAHRIFIYRRNHGEDL